MYVLHLNSISHLHARLDLPHDDLVGVGGDLGDVSQRLQLHLRLDHPQLGDDREEGAVVHLKRGVIVISQV